jgi:hypothetical protein
MKSRRTKRAGRVHVWEKRDIHTEFLFGNLKATGSLEGAGRRRKDNIKMDLKKIM